MNKRTKTALRRWCLYGWTFAKWTMAASAIGVVCGLIGTMFHFGVHEVTAFRGTHPWVLYLLPLAGFEKLASNCHIRIGIKPNLTMAAADGGGAANHP